MPEPKKEFQIH